MVVTVSNMEVAVDMAINMGGKIIIRPINSAVKLTKEV